MCHVGSMIIAMKEVKEAVSVLANANTTACYYIDLVCITIFVRAQSIKNILRTHSVIRTHMRSEQENVYDLHKNGIHFVLCAMYSHWFLALSHFI